MRRVNINQYLGVINNVLDSTQKMSAKMDPYFNIFRSALNDDEEIEAEDYQATQESFGEGVKQYQTNLTTLEKAQAPALLIGVHKILIAHYREFVKCWNNLMQLKRHRKRQWIKLTGVSKKSSGDSIWHSLRVKKQGGCDVGHNLFLILKEKKDGTAIS